jgi:hypothetical protein
MDGREGGRAEGGGQASQLCRGARLAAPVDGRSPTHQRRGYALEEPDEAFITRDGRERMQGGAVSNAWRRVLEPVFHFLLLSTNDNQVRGKY